MVTSKIEKSYGINSTALNSLCWDKGVVPVYLCSSYYIDKELNVYKLIANPIRFEKLEPYKYTKKHRIPVYLLKNDKGVSIQIRIDYIYLTTWYGPMPINSIPYQKCEVYTVDKKLYYRINTYIPNEFNEMIVNGIRFKKVITSEGNNIYVSEYGVVFDANRLIFRRYSFDSKFYNKISVNDKSNNKHHYSVHRLVYQAWKLNGEKLDSSIPIDHIDGFKTRNWIDNLVATTHRANYRKAAYEQNLRTTKWSSEIIEYMCQLMEIGTYGPRDILTKIQERFPDFDISYSACKHRIYELMDDGFWEDISSKYNIHNYRKFQNTHNNVPSDDELIHKICQAYTSGKYTANRQIAKALGTTETIVNKVLRKDMRTDISSQYDIDYVSRRRHPITEEEAIEICNAIMIDDMPLYIAAEKFHREKESIRKLIRRQIYPEISKKYHFELKYPHYEYIIPYNDTKK